MDVLLFVSRTLSVVAVVGLLVTGLVWLFVSYAVPGKPDRVAKQAAFALLSIFCLGMACEYLGMAGELIANWTRFPPGKLSWLGMQYEHHERLNQLLLGLMLWTLIVPGASEKPRNSVLVALMLLATVIRLSEPERPAVATTDCASPQSSTASRPATQSPTAPAPPLVTR